MRKHTLIFALNKDADQHAQLRSPINAVVILDDLLLYNRIRILAQYLYTVKALALGLCLTITRVQNYNA